MTLSARAHAAIGTRTRAAGRPYLAAPALEAARLETRYRPRHPLDLRATVGIHQRGPGDPTMQKVGGVFWRAYSTPIGSATLALRKVGDEVFAAAWGPGGSWVLDQVPALCGAHDVPDAFDAAGHALLAEAHRQNPGLRLGGTGVLADAVITSVLEQKVTAVQAFSAWRYLVRRHGHPAPGPVPMPMWSAPPLSVWRGIPSWEWHRAGVEPSQSKTAVTVAARGTSIQSALDDATSHVERNDVLVSMAGVGPWTSAEIRIRMYGDPDAVSVGDYHLAHHVGYALTGARTDDAGMLQLLEPWKGQRQRVIRLLARSGAREPRKAPRLHPEDHRAR